MLVKKRLQGFGKKEFSWPRFIQRSNAYLYRRLLLDIYKISQAFIVATDWMSNFTLKVKIIKKIQKINKKLLTRFIQKYIVLIHSRNEWMGY